VDRRHERARCRARLVRRVRLRDVRPDLALAFLVLARSAHLRRRHDTRGIELAVRPLTIALLVPASLLDTKRIDGRRLLRLDDEVLTDLTILLSALHHRAREDEDRHRA